MHKEFQVGFELKSLDYIVFFVKEVHLFIGKGGKGKGKRSPWRTKGQEGKGHLGMWRHLLELNRHLSQSTSSRTSKMTAINLLEENSQPSTVNHRVSAIDH